MVQWLDMKKTVIIVGGGFGGVRAALDLSKNPMVEVVLISKNPNFEYYPGIHKIISISKHPMYEASLESVFKEKKNVQVIVDEVVTIDPVTKTVTMTNGESRTADFLVLAMGGQNEYFNIPGLAEYSFGFKSVAEAKRLRIHIEDSFKKYVHADKTESVPGLHFMIAGAGPNGVDVAGEVAGLCQYFADRYKIARSLATVDLVEGNDRILASMPPAVSQHAEKRLRDLGVNILLNRDLVREDGWSATLSDMQVGLKTLIWTAGISATDLVKKIPGFTLGKRNRVAVDQYLQANGFEHVFVIGDIADTMYSGLAQTALHDGSYVAKTINAKIKNKSIRVYKPSPVAFNIGVGPDWSVMKLGKLVTYGFPAYAIRMIIDIKFFLSILPIGEVWKMYLK